MTADADWYLRGADAPVTLALDEALYDPVFQRVERDHRQAPTRRKHVERPRERRLQCGQLLVRRDAQRLEGACRGVDVAAAPATARGGRDLCQLRRRLDRRSLPLPGDRPRDAAARGVFAVAADQVRRPALRAHI